MALTVDDGTDGSVLAAYARFIAETGTHVTFFVNGVHDSWREHARQLRPLLRSGQAQLGNHTWSHPDLTKIPDDQVEEQLSRNHDFIADTFGVDPRPFYRPPYGAHDARVNAVADRLGYTVPVLWSASLEDPSPVSADRIVARAEDAFRRGAIVLSHANHAGTTKALPRFGALLRERRLATYTLDEVWRLTAGATPSS
jgi:peptidoglycan/xylan/chitin deacetylase (PgdA/CDA1 family)